MANIRSPFRAFALLTFALTMSAAAQAQATRTWVSGVGDDANPCSRTAPCKTFTGAITKTALNGEINILDSAGFGTLTIAKSITVDGAGAQAPVMTTGAASANSELFIENCLIDGQFNGVARGIVDERAGGGELFVTDTTVRNTGGTGIGVMSNDFGQQ